MNERAPLPCPEMADIREAIDQLDCQLVALLAERQKMIAAASKVKPSRDNIRDPERIEEVIKLVLQQAEKVGLDAAIAEPVWRQLIESSIAYEYSVFDKK